MAYFVLLFARYWKLSFNWHCLKTLSLHRVWQQLGLHPACRYEIMLAKLIKTKYILPYVTNWKLLIKCLFIQTTIKNVMKAIPFSRVKDIATTYLSSYDWLKVIKSLWREWVGIFACKWSVSDQSDMYSTLLIGRLAIKHACKKIFKLIR